MNDLIRRWQRAVERAGEEQVRIVNIGGELFATSSSQRMGAYRLSRTAAGWACECIANQEHLLPCKHLAALADALGLDVLADMRITLPADAPAGNAA
ncbi:MAG TPA: hypothetical protein VKX16_01255 [Chloroflexota bacterium]|nr:hypothetical protein [Chloroflexota bacterium]